MKVNIEKMQQGGGFATFTPIITSTPNQGATSKQTTTGTPASTSILDESTFKELLTKGGLVNDTNSLVSELIKMESVQQNPYTQSSNRSMSLRMIGKVNELRQSKELWKEAMMTAKSNGGLGEVAVGGYGEVYSKDNNNNIVAMSLSDYKTIENKPKLLTVAELLNERQYNPNMSGRNDLFNAANNSIGLNKITDHVKGLIHALGKETYDTSQTYSKDQAISESKSIAAKLGVKQPTQEDIKSLGILKQVIDGATDYAKVEEKGSSQRKYVEQALDYIWGTLGTNAQQKLTATAIINGSNDPRKYLMEMLYSETSENQTTKITPVKTPGETNSMTGQHSLTQFQMFHKDKLMTSDTKFAFNDPKLGVLFRGSVSGVAPIMTTKGASVGVSTIEDILYKHDYNAFLQGNNVYFGNKKVDNYDFSKIIYDGQDAAKVYMPVDRNGSPDYEGFKKFKELYSVYETNKNNWSTRQAEKYFSDNGYNLKIDERYEDGKKVKIIRDNASVKPFLVMYGYTNDATDLVEGNTEQIYKLSSDEEKAVKPILQQVWTIGKGKTAKNTTPSNLFGTNYYKGMIAIPYRAEASAIIDAMVGHGPTEKVSSILDVQRNLNFSSNQPITGSTSSNVFNK